MNKMQQNTVKSSRIQKAGALAFLLALGTASLLPAAALPSRVNTDPVLIDREPLVIYDVSGSGIAGPIHRHLTIYSDGLATYSSLNLSGVWADFTWLTSDQAGVVTDSLIAVGGMELGDRWSSTADIPMTTITVFEGSQPFAMHNTFSFYETGGKSEYQAVVEMIEAFIRKNFLD